MSLCRCVAVRTCMGGCQVVSARHLPKMDGMRGRIDAYTVCSLESEQHKTSVKKNTLDPRP
eukprot:23550-Rhodomonas_salina.1